MKPPAAQPSAGAAPTRRAPAPCCQCRRGTRRKPTQVRSTPRHCGPSWRGASASIRPGAQQIRDAVGGDPALADLARQLAIDITPEGLRIQILDEERQSMFAFGSAERRTSAAAAAEGDAGAGEAAAGHLHRRPYRRRALSPASGRTNWELSSRARQRDPPPAGRGRPAGSALPQRHRQRRPRPAAAGRPAGGGQPAHRHRRAAPISAPSTAMLAIGALGFLLACVFGSYLVSGGSIAPLAEALPFELLTIGGAASALRHGQQHARREAHGRRLQQDPEGRGLQQDRLHRPAVPAVSSWSGWPAPRATWRSSRISRSRGKRGVPEVPPDPGQPLRHLDDLRLPAHGGHERRRSQPDRGRDGARAEEDAERGTARARTPCRPWPTGCRRSASSPPCSA